MIVGLLTVSKARLDLEKSSTALCHAAWKGDVSQVYIYICSTRQIFKSVLTFISNLFIHTHSP